MPSGPTHVVAGAFSYAALALSQHTPPDLALAGAAVAGLAALGPDLDLPGSTASRVLWPITYPTALLLGWVFGHRGGTHSALAALAVSCAAWQTLPLTLAAGVVLGWWSHLVLDAFDPRSRRGIPWLWPLSR